MVKIDVTLDFPNAALYEDFLEAADAEGLTPKDYLLLLIEQELGDSERAALDGSPGYGKGGGHADTDG
jgi:hypothetical protein